ncbi:MAG: hypothetical protein MJ195_02710 [Mycoplasmoidaceae bacterium]|nr:hypothetical protein [Mycoplasmoidaceae bacterium]
MKIKTKLLSVLGATAIASSGLGLIASCSFKPSPKDEYEPPRITPTVTTAVTESGSPKCTIPDFKFDRPLYIGEKVTVAFSQSVNGTVDVKSVVVNLEHTDGSSVGVDVTLDVDEGSTVEGLKAAFKLTFTFYYQGHEIGVPLGNEFVVSYTPAYSPNQVLCHADTIEKRTFDFGTRGTSTYVLDPTLFTLENPLGEHERVRVESTNAFVKAQVGYMATGDQNIPITLTIVNYDQYTELRPKFDFKFTISVNSEIKYSVVHKDFEAIYKPKARNIGITYEGETLALYPTNRGDREISMDRYFHLSRLLNETTNEKVEIKLEDPETGETPENLTYTYQLVDYRYYTFNIKYTGEEDYTDKFIKFRIHFDIYDDLSDDPIYQQTFPRSSGSDDQKSYFSFNYIAP